MMGTHQKGEGGCLHLAEYQTGQCRERRLSEGSEGGGAYVGFFRRQDKGEDPSNQASPIPADIVPSPQMWKALGLDLSRLE